jgi:hypothetical protein
VSAGCYVLFNQLNLSFCLDETLLRLMHPLAVMKLFTIFQWCYVRHIDSLKCIANKQQSFVSRSCVVWCIHPCTSAKLVHQRIILDACVST